MMNASYDCAEYATNGFIESYPLIVPMRRMPPPFAARAGALAASAWPPVRATPPKPAATAARAARDRATTAGERVMSALLAWRLFVVRGDLIGCSEAPDYRLLRPQ